MSRLEEILQKVEGLPPFPGVAQKVMALMEDPEVSVQELATVLQFDPSLTAGVLKISNSAYYGQRRKVSSIDEAVVIIGQDRLREIVITCSAAQFLRAEAGSGYDHGHGDLWRHSIAVAIMAKLLAPHLAGLDEGKLFTTGLLHDVGKLVLDTYVAESVDEIGSKIRANYALIEAEQELFGTTHAEVGAAILERWDFPQDMVVAVRQHHDVEVLTKDPLSAAIGLSNILVVSVGIGIGTGGLATKVQGEGVEALGIKPRTLDHLMVELLVEVDRAQELFELQM